MAKNFRLSLDNGQSAVSVSLIVPLRPLSTVKNIEKLVLRERDSYSNILPVTAIGGEGGIRFSISPEIPNGLTFSNTTGLINGTPQNSLDIRSFTVTAVDSQGQTSSQSFFLEISAVVPSLIPKPCIDPPESKDHYAVYQQAMVLIYTSGYIQKNNILVKSTKTINAAIVNSWYQSVIGRPAEQFGLNAWANRLDNNESESAVFQEFYLAATQGEVAQHGTVSKVQTYCQYHN